MDNFKTDIIYVNVSIINLKVGVGTKLTKNNN